MKKLLVVLMILFVGILLCGCTSQPATPPATTVAPTVAPTAMETTVAPTVVATTATPAPVNTTAKPTATPTPQIVVTIKMTNYNTVDPSGTVVVKKGTKVVWVSQNMAWTNIIKVEGLFTSGALNNGDSFSYTFDKAGTYNWISTTNGVFKGTITVQ
jgi:plastocyanin